jgi:hypothetical protein
MIKQNRRVFLEVSAGALAAGLGSRVAAAPGGVGEHQLAANHGAEPLAAAMPANEGSRPLRLGLILGIGKDPDAAMAKVHELGLPTCQVFVTEIEPQLVGRLRGALDKYKIEATSLVLADRGKKCGTSTRGR